LDQGARREVLACAGFDLGGVLFEQALVDGTLHVDADPNPRLAVDERDDALELCRIGELVLCLAEDGADQTLLFGEGLEGVTVLEFEVVSGERGQFCPNATWRG
jgi:hypothetical protein